MSKKALYTGVVSPDAELEKALPISGHAAKASVHSAHLQKVQEKRRLKIVAAVSFSSVLAFAKLPTSEGPRQLTNY